MISAQNLYKKFADKPVLQGVSFQVNKGEVLGFLGENGAGKSTTMRILTGYLQPDTGHVNIKDYNIANSIEARRNIGYLPEGAPLYREMTVRNFLGFMGRMRQLSKAETRQAVEKVIMQTRLESVVDQRIETLSKGFKRRVGLAQALLHDPEILILDEPTDGLDPNQKFHVRQLIKQLAPEKAIIISTHLLEELETICTRVILLHSGRIVLDNTPQQMLKDSNNDMDGLFRKLTAVV